MQTPMLTANVFSSVGKTISYHWVNTRKVPEVGNRGSGNRPRTTCTLVDGKELVRGDRHTVRGSEITGLCLHIS